MKNIFAAIVVFCLPLLAQDIPTSNYAVGGPTPAQIIGVACASGSGFSCDSTGTGALVRESGATLKGGTAFTVTDSAGENLTAGQVCYRKAGGYFKAKADTITNFNGPLAVAAGTITSGTTGTFQTFGSFLTSGLTANSTYYLSASSAGAMTTTAPTTSRTWVVNIGDATSTTRFWFDRAGKRGAYQNL